jgi:hypothetical protein
MTMMLEESVPSFLMMRKEMDALGNASVALSLEAPLVTTMATTTTTTMAMVEIVIMIERRKVNAERRT